MLANCAQLCQIFEQNGFFRVVRIALVAFVDES
jgi:hypothetical protein